MGRAARWLRGLLGGGGRKSPDPDEPGEALSGRGKKKWVFVKTFREKEVPPRHGAGAAGGSYREVPGPARPPYARPAGSMVEEQNKRAIAVAAATAAVAEAAVAAAQAAAAVVRLTSSGRGDGGFADPAAAFSNGYGKREKWAAVRIQSAFRGYLARRALKALKGLVKLQALVRGNIVRKQAAETLRCMQALVRVQARARASRALHSEHSGSEKSLSTHAGPPTPEKYEQAAQAGFAKSDLSSNIRRTSMKPSAVNVEFDRANPAGWNWLDRWMEERYWDSRELTKRAAISASTDDERSAKILEVDPGKPQFNNKRRNNHHYSSCSTLTSDQHSRSFATIPDSPSKDSTIAQQSVPSPSSVDMHHSLNALRFPVEVGDYVESPHVYSASSRHGSSRRGPFTPSKSECSHSFFSGYSDYPNYMANTESTRAKLRSQSAPKQRPDYEKLLSSGKRLTAQEYGQNPLGASAQKSSSLHAKFTNKAYPGSGRLDRLGMPIRY